MDLVKVSFLTIPSPFSELLFITFLFFLHFWHSEFFPGISPLMCEKLPLEILLKQVCWPPIFLYLGMSFFSLLTFIPNGYFLWIENYGLRVSILQHFSWTDIGTLSIKSIVYSDFLSFYPVSFFWSRRESTLHLVALSP